MRGKEEIVTKLLYKTKKLIFGGNNINKDMAATPVEIIGLKNPLCKEQINKISKKMSEENKKYDDKMAKGRDI